MDINHYKEDNPHPKVKFTLIQYDLESPHLKAKFTLTQYDLESAETNIYTSLFRLWMPLYAATNTYEKWKIMTLSM